MKVLVWWYFRGGWTTTLVSALDTRINYSFPVARVANIFKKAIDFLDSENWDYDLYHEINYLHLYALGSISQKNSKRLSLKILNKYDECCFSGNRYEYFYPKLKNILDKIEENRFQIFIDDSHSEHKISQETLEIIHNKILMEDQKK